MSQNASIFIWENTKEIFAQLKFILHLVHFPNGLFKFLY